MKKTRVWLYPLIFAGIGILLNIAAVAAVVATSGTSIGPFGEMIVFIATWPSLLAGVPKLELVASGKMLIFNVVAWTFLGFAIGLVVAWQRQVTSGPSGDLFSL